MTKFTIINLIRKNITKAQDGFWTVKGLNTHRTVTNIVKLSNGSYYTSHNLQTFNSFMSAVASLVNMFGYKKPVNAILGMVLAAISMAAVSTPAHADQMSQLNVMSAEVELAENLTKFALLTHSLTEEGQQMSQLVGYQMANEITSGINQGVADLLSQGKECSDINSSYSSKIVDGFEAAVREDSKLSPVAENSLQKVKDNIRTYIVVECKNLSE